MYLPLCVLSELLREEFLLFLHTMYNRLWSYMKYCVTQELRKKRLRELEVRGQEAERGESEVGSSGHPPASESQRRLGRARSGTPA